MAHRASQALPDPTLARTTRAWHVVLDTGGDTTVTAHKCDIRNGVLLFRNHPLAESQSVIIRAFSPTQWREMVLVDTPAAAAVHVDDRPLDFRPAPTPGWR